MFEYYSFLVSYNAEWNVYKVLDAAYNLEVGSISLEPGPGYVIDISTSFLDSSQAYALAELLSDLNSTLEDVYY